MRGLGHVLFFPRIVDIFSLKILVSLKIVVFIICSWLALKWICLKWVKLI